MSKKKRAPAIPAKTEPTTAEPGPGGWRSRWTDTTRGQRLMLGIIFFFLALALLRQYVG